MLRRGFTEEEARQQLDLAIDWGRYGELYEFDANTGQLKLELADSEPKGEASNSQGSAGQT